MIRKTFPILVFIAITASPLLAQAPVDQKAAIDALKQVAFLQGTWSGRGWVQMGQGPKQEFTQTEAVEAKLDGAVLLIEGIGHSEGENARKVHDALAVLSFDPVGETLVFSSFMAGRRRLDVVPEITQNTFTWSFSPPKGGEVRYSIQVESDTWQEVGEFSTDGESWHQFLEMSLKRK
jgi:hypothetical protein